MSLPQESTLCPLCHGAYKALSQHLRRVHFVCNTEERKLLLNLSSGRVNIRTAPCPVLGCNYCSTRLDRHLQDGHPELTRNQMIIEEQVAKRTMSVQLLANLRATNPQVGMVSDFDIDLRGDVEMQGVEEVDPGVVCLRPECVAGRAELQVAIATIERLQREALIRVKTIKVKSRKLRRYERVVKEVSVPGWKLISIILVVQIILITIFFISLDEGRCCWQLGRGGGDGGECGGGAAGGGGGGRAKPRARGGGGGGGGGRAKPRARGGGGGGGRAKPRARGGGGGPSGGTAADHLSGDGERGCNEAPGSPSQYW